MRVPIAVEARFETDGSLRPLAFVWEDEIIRISAYGRRWEQDDEDHFLVMTADERVYELAYLQSEGLWHLCRRPQDLRGRRQRA
jgi:hypothetical protein